jgi:hypothetical protein
MKMLHLTADFGKAVLQTTNGELLEEEVVKIWSKLVSENRVENVNFYVESDFFFQIVGGRWINSSMKSENYGERRLKRRDWCVWMVEVLVQYCLESVIENSMKLIIF